MKRNILEFIITLMHLLIIMALGVSLLAAFIAEIYIIAMIVLFAFILIAYIDPEKVSEKIWHKLS